MGLIDLPPELLVAIALFLGSTRSISRYDLKNSKSIPKAVRKTSYFSRSRRDANSIIPKSLAAGADVNGSLYILKFKDE
ncbi:hypothetical protein CRV24_004144 [Beauveria bassiana]|nr:hypothetical protein CRV24_004144 [Beauveria bassiana]KAH8710753.1 hypothetical protein HC256_007584 [Beauveria bassiana]